MQKIVIVLLSCLPILVNAQTGIRFQTLSNWEQVKTMAKRENKYIFVDFYATWCGPCKEMDRFIYPSVNLGVIANSQFISIKIQQDKTPLDNIVIKNWYSDADSLARVLNIISFPSLLFFSPDGKLISKVVGYQKETDLLTLFENAMTTNMEYQTQVEKYLQGNLSYPEMPNLALKAQEIGNIQLADSIAMDYKNKYLYQLSDSLLLTKENLRFITQFPSIITSKERIFNFFFNEPTKMDELKRAGYSKDIVQYIISKEEIDSKLGYLRKTNIGKHDWNRIRLSIEDKYGLEYANLLTSLSAKIAYYGKTHDWKRYANLINDTIRKYPPEINGYEFANITMIGMVFQRDDWNLNSGAWNIFLHCNDKSILKTALKWSSLSILVAGTDNGINPADQYYDTKANLLYKIGRVQDAIDAERKAYEIAKRNSEKHGKKDGGEEYLATIEKMKEGMPTWKIN